MAKSCITPCVRPGGKMVRMLDLFCGAGGAAMGYHQSGFDCIVGVDIQPQPRYPFEFVQADAIEYLGDCGKDFDFVHASPPCQAHSPLRYLPQNRANVYPDFIPPVLELLERSDTIWVVENVMGARKSLEAHYLCGYMFGRPYARHRLFGSNALWLAPAHPKHPAGNYVDADAARKGMSRWAAGAGVALTGHLTDPARAKAAMEIDWMRTSELVQAIPPVYTRHIGEQMLRLVGNALPAA